MDYFGEKTKDFCDNCGNCHRRYQEEDMTAQAKWVINCVYETEVKERLNVFRDNTSVKSDNTGNMGFFSRRRFDV